MARSVVVQPCCSGGFSVVYIRLKVWSLIAQWVRRFSASPSSWVPFMSYWFHCAFNVSCFEVFSRPFCFNAKLLPPFYRSLLLAWRALDGAFSSSRSTLVIASSSPHHVSPVTNMSAKFCYLNLLFENMCPSYVWCPLLVYYVEGTFSLRPGPPCYRPFLEDRPWGSLHRVAPVFFWLFLPSFMFLRSGCGNSGASILLLPIGSKRPFLAAIAHVSFLLVLSSTC